MKIAFSFIIILLFITASSAQSQKIGRDEYEKVFDFAVSKTNSAYPVIFTWTTTEIENGKTIRTITEVNENESREYYRIKRTEVADGRETNSYQITVGFGNVFCSSDGILWKPSQYECYGPRGLYGPRDAESVEYGVTENKVKGKKVKIYREYSVFAPFEADEKKEFREKISTIDSRGFFLTVVDTEGTLSPRTITLKRTQSWVTNAKIKPIVAPKVN